jgi:hypothetical protein
MSNAARSSSKRAVFAGIAAALACGIASGCNTTSALTLAEPIAAAPAIAEDFAYSDIEIAKVPLPAEARRKQADAAIDTKITTAAVPELPQSDPAWCRYLAADAGAEASILRSPTLSASASDGGSKSVSLGMNLVDFSKANEIEKAARLRCEQKISEGSLQASLLIAGQSVTALGASAKAAYLGQELGRLDVIAAQSRARLSEGVLTAPEQSLITARIARVRQEYSLAKADALKIESMDGGKGLLVSDAASKLQKAEEELQASNARMRSLNAMSVNVETGWTRKDDALLLISSDAPRYYGKVSVGVRLGALGPSRRRYEDAAQQARIEALSEPYTGIVWQAARGEDNIKSNLKSLRASRSAIASALSNARGTLRELRGTDRIELASTRLIAELDVISLTGELAAIDATLASLSENAELAGSVNK